MKLGYNKATYEHVTVKLVKIKDKEKKLKVVGGGNKVHDFRGSNDKNNNELVNIRGSQKTVSDIFKQLTEKKYQAIYFWNSTRSENIV